VLRQPRRQVSLSGSGRTAENETSVFDEQRHVALQDVLRHQHLERQSIHTVILSACKQPATFLHPSTRPNTSQFWDHTPIRHSILQIYNYGTRDHLKCSECMQTMLRVWGCAPDPALGAHSAPQTHSWWDRAGCPPPRTPPSLSALRVSVFHTPVTFFFQFYFLCL